MSKKPKSGSDEKSLHDVHGSPLTSRAWPLFTQGRTPSTTCRAAASGPVLAADLIGPGNSVIDGNTLEIYGYPLISSIAFDILALDAKDLRVCRCRSTRPARPPAGGDQTVAARICALGLALNFSSAFDPKEAAVKLPLSFFVSTMHRLFTQGAGARGQRGCALRR